MLINVEPGFFITKFDGKNRNLYPIHFDRENQFDSLLTSGTNPCDYLYTTEIINQLKKLIDADLFEYEWGGGERTWFFSEPELTIATDNFGRNGDVKIPTPSILDIMEMHKRLMDEWPKQDILNLVGQAFEMVKSSRSYFIEDEESSRYRVHDGESGLIILLVLLEQDFSMAHQEFCDQIKFKDQFFPCSA